MQLNENVFKRKRKQVSFVAKQIGGISLPRHYKVYKATKIKEISNMEGICHINAENNKQQILTIETHHVLVATGRKPNTASLNLDNVGINIDNNGTIVVDMSSVQAHPTLNEAIKEAGLDVFKISINK
ncbi:MAG: FAD-dependent oxidoreductase [Clostridia bacterium]|nr:FAD-dependent oxidoreductase [Clostridia bacterium]